MAVPDPDAAIMAIQMFPIEIYKQMEWYRSIFVMKIQDSYQRIRIDIATANISY